VLALVDRRTITRGRARRIARGARALGKALSEAKYCLDMVRFASRLKQGNRVRLITLDASAVLVS
jgi:hypothetical protein